MYVRIRHTVNTFTLVHFNVPNKHLPPYCKLTIRRRQGAFEIVRTTNVFWYGRGSATFVLGIESQKMKYYFFTGHNTRYFISYKNVWFYVVYAQCLFLNQSYSWAPINRSMGHIWAPRVVGSLNIMDGI